MFKTLSHCFAILVRGRNAAFYGGKKLHTFFGLSCGLKAIDAPSTSAISPFSQVKRKVDETFGILASIIWFGLAGARTPLAADTRSGLQALQESTAKD